MLNDLGSELRVVGKRNEIKCHSLFKFKLQGVNNLITKAFDYFQKHRGHPKVVMLLFFFQSEK